MRDGFGDPFGDVPPIGSEPRSEEPHAEDPAFAFDPEHQHADEDSGPNTKSIIKVVAAVVVCVTVVITLFAYLLFSATRGPIDEANNFLAELRAQDYPGAYALTEPACIGVDEAAFTESVIGLQLRSYNLRKTSVTNADGKSTGSASGEIGLGNGDTQPITVFLSKFGEDWKICGFGIGS